MSVKRMIAIAVIFAAACGGWGILGTATTLRSTESAGRLGEQVANLWGVPLVQEAPSLGVEIPGSDRLRWIMPSRNDVKVALQAEHRKKGLIWYPTYTCQFDGAYTISNEETVTQKVRLHFRFPAQGGTYDDFGVWVDETQLRSAVDVAEGVGEILEIEPGQTKEFRVKYTTRGIGEWRYRMDPNAGRVQDLDLTVATNFRAVDYPDGSL
ncbi:MAG TPA: hypothetical protein VM118_11975, partial [Acidobacteriota bacterium]|nr:hypothetical protein [Acidobacteriota bacterium]